MGNAGVAGAMNQVRALRDIQHTRRAIQRTDRLGRGQKRPAGVCDAVADGSKTYERQMHGRNGRVQRIGAPGHHVLRERGVEFPKFVQRDFRTQQAGHVSAPRLPREERA